MITTSHPFFINSTIDLVEFYIDDESDSWYLGNDTTSPYSYTWDQKVFSETGTPKHTIKIVAYDTLGYSNNATITVRKIF